MEAEVQLNLICTGLPLYFTECSVVGVAGKPAGLSLVMSTTLKVRSFNMPLNDPSRSPMVNVCLASSQRMGMRANAPCS